MALGDVVEQFLTFMQYVGLLSGSNLSIPGVPDEWLSVFSSLNLGSLGFPDTDYRSQFLILCAGVPMILTTVNLILFKPTSTVVWYFGLLLSLALLGAGLVTQFFPKDIISDVISRQLSTSMLMYAGGIGVGICILAFAISYFLSPSSSRVRPAADSHATDEEALEEDDENDVDDVLDPEAIKRALEGSPPPTAWSLAGSSFVGIVFIFLSLFLIPFVTPSQIGLPMAQQYLDMVFIFVGTNVGYALLALGAWTIVYAFLRLWGKARKFFHNMGSWFRTNFTKIMLVFVGIIYIPLCTTTLSLATCEEMSCPAGQHFYQRPSRLTLAFTYFSQSAPMCETCAFDFETCPIAEELCPAGIADSRLVPDPGLSCTNNIMPYYWPAAVIMCISFIFGIPYLFFRLMRFCSKVLKELSITIEEINVQIEKREVLEKMNTVKATLKSRIQGALLDKTSAIGNLRSTPLPLPPAPPAAAASAATLTPQKQAFSAASGASGGSGTPAHVALNLKDVVAMSPASASRHDVLKNALGAGKRRPHSPKITVVEEIGPGVGSLNPPTNKNHHLVNNATSSEVRPLLASGGSAGSDRDLMGDTLKSSETSSLDPADVSVHDIDDSPRPAALTEKQKMSILAATNKMKGLMNKAQQEVPDDDDNADTSDGSPRAAPLTEKQKMGILAATNKMKGLMNKAKQETPEDGDSSEEDEEEKDPEKQQMKLTEVLAALNTKNKMLQMIRVHYSENSEVADLTKDEKKELSHELESLWSNSVDGTKNAAKALYQAYMYKWRYYKLVSTTQKLLVVSSSIFLARFADIALATLGALQISFFLIFVFSRPYIKTYENLFTGLSSLVVGGDALVTILVNSHTMSPISMWPDWSQYMLTGFNCLVPLVSLGCLVYSIYQTIALSELIDMNKEKTDDSKKGKAIAHMKKGVDRKVTDFVLKTLANFFLFLGVCTFLATAFGLVGVLRDFADSPVLPPTVAVAEYLHKCEEAKKVEFAGYDDWSEFTANCCCMEGLPDSALTKVEKWVCRNSKLKERARVMAGPTGALNGTMIRPFCSSTFNDGFYPPDANACVDATFSGPPLHIATYNGTSTDFDSTVLGDHLKYLW